LSISFQNRIDLGGYGLWMAQDVMNPILPKV
jgi:hypothetical protein